VALRQAILDASQHRGILCRGRHDQDIGNQPGLASVTGFRYVQAIPFPGALAMLARPGLDVVRGDNQLSTWRYLLLGPPLHLTIQLLKLLLPDLSQGCHLGPCASLARGIALVKRLEQVEAVSPDFQRQSIPFVLTFG
jgi:hypothetical protein